MAPFFLKKRLKNETCNTIFGVRNLWVEDSKLKIDRQIRASECKTTKPRCEALAFVCLADCRSFRFKKMGAFEDKERPSRSSGFDFRRFSKRLLCLEWRRFLGIAFHRSVFPVDWLRLFSCPSRVPIRVAPKGPAARAGRSGGRALRRRAATDDGAEAREGVKIG